MAQIPENQYCADYGMLPYAPYLNIGVLTVTCLIINIVRITVCYRMQPPPLPHSIIGLAEVEGVNLLSIKIRDEVRKWGQSVA